MTLGPKDFLVIWAVWTGMHLALGASRVAYLVGYHGCERMGSDLPWSWTPSKDGTYEANGVLYLCRKQAG